MTILFATCVFKVLDGLKKPFQQPPFSRAIVSVVSSNRPVPLQQAVGGVRDQLAVRCEHAYLAWEVQIDWWRSDGAVAVQ